MKSLGRRSIEELLNALGALLEAAGQSDSIVIVGGASLNLLGLIQRTTQDVDVVARAERGERDWTFVKAEPFPEPLKTAVGTVARDFGLSEDWMNTKVAGQWGELPQFLFQDLEWRTYGSLKVGIAARRTLIALKLHAAVDRDSRSVHYQDLLELSPTDTELEEVRQVVVSQDAGPDFPKLVEEAVSRVKRDLKRNR